MEAALLPDEDALLPDEALLPLDPLLLLLSEPQPERAPTVRAAARVMPAHFFM
ncbi:hypothetical protein JOC55_002813 [Paenibacillus sacheonensis]|nr:hypothetical protein [Paenibacillus sacheonensis]